MLLKSLLQKPHTAECDVFASMAGSMAQMASQCEVGDCSIYFSSCCSCWMEMWTGSVLQRFYNSGWCTEPSNSERRHLCRFHQSPGSRKITSATASDTKVSSTSEWYFPLPPGGASLHFSQLLCWFSQTIKEGVGLKLKSVSWQNHPSSPDEDVDIDIRVSPGTYAVTASMADLEQQTLLVSLKAGESFKLKFNFWHQKLTAAAWVYVINFAFIFNIGVRNFL